MLARNTAAFVVARGGPALVNFAAIAVYTRLLSRTEYGYYVLAAGGAGFAAAIVFQWVILAALRELSGQSCDRQATLSALLVGFAISSGLGAITAVGTMAVLPSSAPVSLIFSAFALLIAQSWFELNLKVTVADSRPLRFGVMSLMRAVIGVGAGIGFVLAGFAAVGVIVGAIIANLAATLPWLIDIWGGVRVRKADSRLLRRLAAYGIPLTFTFAFELIVVNSDRFFLGAMHSAAEAASYAVAYDLAQQSLGVIMIVVSLAAFPLAVQAYERRDVDSARGQMSRLATLLLAIAVPSAVGLAMIAPALAHAFVGPEFSERVQIIVPIVAVAAMIGGFRSYYLDLAFQLSRTTSMQVRLAAVAAALNIALNFALIPRYGALGAAWATLACFAASALLSRYFGRSAFALPIPWRELVRVLIASAAMAVAVSFVRLESSIAELVLQVLVGITCYVAAALVLNVATCRSSLGRIVASHAVAGLTRD